MMRHEYERWSWVAVPTYEKVQRASDDAMLRRLNEQVEEPMFYLNDVLRGLSATDAERLARHGVRCSHLGCDAPVVAVRTSKTPTMPAPGYYYLCAKHAAAKKGE